MHPIPAASAQKTTRAFCHFRLPASALCAKYSDTLYSHRYVRLSLGLRIAVSNFASSLCNSASLLSHVCVVPTHLSADYTSIYPHLLCAIYSLPLHTVLTLSILMRSTCYQLSRTGSPAHSELPAGPLHPFSATSLSGPLPNCAVFTLALHR